MLPSTHSDPGQSSSSGVEKGGSAGDLIGGPWVPWRKRGGRAEHPYETNRRVELMSEGGKGLNWPTRDALRTEDREGRLVAIFGSDWVRRYA